GVVAQRVLKPVGEAGVGPMEAQAGELDAVAAAGVGGDPRLQDGDGGAGGGGGQHLAEGGRQGGGGGGAAGGGEIQGGGGGGGEQSRGGERCGCEALARPCEHEGGAGEAHERRGKRQGKAWQAAEPERQSAGEECGGEQHAGGGQCVRAGTRGVRGSEQAM